MATEAVRPTLQWRVREWARRRYGEYDKRPFSERIEEFAARNGRGLLVLLAVILTAIAFSLFPGEARAIPQTPDMLPDNPGGYPFQTAIEGITEGFSGLLRDGANGVLNSATDLLMLAGGDTILGNSFTEMLSGPGGTTAASGLYRTFESVSHNIIVPFGQMIVSIFLVVALGNVVTNASKNEAGVDAWQLCMVFVSFGFASALVQSCWYLMVIAYNIVAYVINAVSATALTAIGSMAVPSECTAPGALLVIFIASLIIWIVCLLIMFIAQISCISRGLQIYVQTTLAPLPMAFITSESSRGMATGFLKRWMATLLAGLILILLIVCMNTIMSGMGDLSLGANVANDMDGVSAWLGQVFMTLMIYVAIAFCMFRSGQWAREFVGV